MKIRCGYDDCDYELEISGINDINEKCPLCNGFWNEQDDEYYILTGNVRDNSKQILIGCVFILNATQRKLEVKLSNGQRVLGRNDFKFLFDDEKFEYISGTHISLRIENNSLIIKDEQSTNGTYIGLSNSDKVNNDTILEDKEWLSLGQEKFLVKLLYEKIESIVEEVIENDSGISELPKERTEVLCFDCKKPLHEPLPNVCQFCNTYNDI